METCDFPAAVALLDEGGGEFCTGVLVHPRIVMTAAHCVDGQTPANVLFGERVPAPATVASVVGCEIHPEYVQVGSDELNPWDLAYCELAADAPAVPIVPALMGCEAEELTVDAEVTLVGFGFDDEQNLSGNVQKRVTVNVVQEVDEVANDLILLGVDDSSACFGDSGGPAYMQLSDGTWRVVGITSEPHPDVMGQPLVCGYGVIYDLVHLEMGWFEESSGYDLTPCFDADGTWNPNEDCGGFPTDLEDGGDWGGACATRSRSGLSATCGDPFVAVGTSTGGETDTDTDSETDGGDTTGAIGGGTAASSSGGGEDSSSTTGVDTPDPSSSDPTSSTPGTDESSSGGSAATGDDGGCGCRAGGGGRGLWWLGLGLVALPPRRRRR